MCNNKDYQHSVTFRRYNFLIVILFLITFLSLGFGLYATFKVQSLSYNLNLVLIKCKIETFDEHKGYQNSDDNLKRPFDELKLLPGRIKRNNEESHVTLKQDTNVPNESNNLHYIKKKSANYDENTEIKSFTPIYPNIYRDHNHLGIITERSKSIVAIHFEGDTSSYVYGQHTNFNGNGHLRHLKKTFIDWKESEWGEVLNSKKYFKMNDGIVTIKESGFYFIYAQIFYLDEHDMNGYRVYRNNDTVFQCTKTSHSSERMMKGNTCYTAGLTYLDKNDNISINDISNGRYTLFEPGKSFFGLLKIGNTK